jgi:hypothetical protein
MLSGAAHTEADPMTTSTVLAAPPPAHSTGVVPVAASVPPPPVTEKTPAPPVSAAAPPPTGPSTAGAPVAADEFPNVNVAPPQPDGKLLTADERAKLIAELNALAARQTGGQ